MKNKTLLFSILIFSITFNSGCKKENTAPAGTVTPETPSEKGAYFIKFTEDSKNVELGQNGIYYYSSLFGNYRYGCGMQKG